MQIKKITYPVYLKSCKTLCGIIDNLIYLLDYFIKQNKTLMADETRILKKKKDCLKTQVLIQMVHITLIKNLAAVQCNDILRPKGKEQAEKCTST